MGKNGAKSRIRFHRKTMQYKTGGGPQILLAVDHFSKWPTIKTCSNNDTKTLTKTSANQFSIPKTLLIYINAVLQRKTGADPQILQAVDHFSNWPSVKICCKHDTKTLTNFSANEFNVYGVPKRFLTDINAVLQ